MALEHRYKGIRAPHKIKFGISGCTRECAEAQGKDVGIIATENGWNLYVCGNGGMKPRHADLLAADLDEETLMRYLDRFMMFYIRTADKLQRTSVWLESLEGDSLPTIGDPEDKLGINDQLEARSPVCATRSPASGKPLSRTQQHKCVLPTLLIAHCVTRMYKSCANESNTARPAQMNASRSGFWNWRITHEPVDPTMPVK